MDFPIVIRPLTAEEGGGYLAVFPDLFGCVSDGSTPEEALQNAKEALAEWLETNTRLGREIPVPGSASEVMRRRNANARKALDARIEKVETDLTDLRAEVEHASEWLRFSELSGVLPDTPVEPSNKPSAHPRDHRN